MKDFTDLKLKIGEKRAKVFVGKLQRLNAKMKMGGIGRAYELYVNSLISNRKFSVAEKFIIKHDSLKIDSWWFDERSMTLVLIQSKLKDYKKPKPHFSEIISNIERILINGRGNTKEKREWKEIIKCANKIKDQSIKIKFIYNGISSKVTVKHPNIIIEEKNILDILDSSPRNKYFFTLEHKGDQVRDFKSSTSSTTTIIMLKKFLAQLDEFSELTVEQLFQENVRGYLNRSKLIEDIKETLLKYKNQFHLFNNGLLIATDKVIVNEGTGLNPIIENGQIINGQQTIMSLLKIYKNKKSDIPATATILVKVFYTKNKNDLQKIVVTTNSQTKIDIKDIFTITTNFSELQKYAIASGYYFRVRRGLTKREKLESAGLKIVAMTNFAKHLKIYNDISDGKDLKIAQEQPNIIINELFNSKYLRHIDTKNKVKDMLELVAMADTFFKENPKATYFDKSTYGRAAIIYVSHNREISLKDAKIELQKFVKSNKAKGEPGRNYFRNIENMDKVVDEYKK